MWFCQSTYPLCCVGSVEIHIMAQVVIYADSVAIHIMAQVVMYADSVVIHIIAQL